MACNKAAIDRGSRSDGDVRGTSIWLNQGSWLGVCTLAGSLISVCLRKSWAPWPVPKAFYGHTAAGNGSGSLSLSLVLEPGQKSKFSTPKWLGDGQGMVALCPRQQAGMTRPRWPTHRRVSMCMFSCGPDSSPVRATANLPYPTFAPKGFMGWRESSAGKVILVTSTRTRAGFPESM